MKEENKATAMFECMVCKYVGATRIEHRGVEVLPCPKCKGAFVDRWVIGKYEKHYTEKQLSHKEKTFKHIKETIDKLDIDHIERVTIDVDDRYEETIDIDISIELKR